MTTKGFGTQPVKKWHITKALEDSKAFEIANKAKKDITDPNFYLVGVVVSSGILGDFELVAMVQRKKKGSDIFFGTVDHQTKLTNQQSKEIGKEFSKTDFGLSILRRAVK
jgi:hypothetical protein